MQEQKVVVMQFIHMARALQRFRVESGFKQVEAG
jgi:hypothetical protein